MMQTSSRKRRKSEDIEYKRTCISPSSFETPTAGQAQKEQHICNPLHFEQWDVNDVESFLSSKGFDKYASVFQGIKLACIVKGEGGVFFIVHCHRGACMTYIR